MNQETISPDDPRLTLYALGEMEAPERAGFERLLEQDAAARQVVAEIRAMAATVTAALEHEPAEGASKATGKILRFPQAYYMISGLAAACFALFFVLSQNERAYRQESRLVEVPLTQAKVAKDDKGAAEASVAMALPPAPVAEKPPAVTFVLDQPGPIQTAPSLQDAYGPSATRMRADVSTLPADGLAEAQRGKAEVAAAENERKKEFDREMAVAGLQKSQQLAAGGAAAIAPAASPPPEVVAPNAVAFAEEPKKATITGSTGAAAVAGDETITLAPFMVAAAPAKGKGRDIGAITLGGQRADTRSFRASREQGANTEAYASSKDNAFLRVVDQPLSTFSIDVDTASYANMRRFLSQHQRPPVDAVRIEELVNYFPYDYAPPTGDQPFAAHLEVANAPWAPEHRLVRIGLKGRDISDARRPAANLVFLLDVSGSMNQPNKLPLVKKSLRLLVEKLRADDRVAIAVYAGQSGLVLPSTSAREKAKILEAIDELNASGSTNGGMGIHLAYDIAKANFVAGGVNRVILATDGDFNVGTTSEGELVRLIEEKAKSGVFLSVLGFGMGNLKDSTLEQLADKGNGNYAYIDSLAEAKKTLVEQAGGTLVTIAKDVKIQVEFNPAKVQAYRLIGYENRLLAKEDFNNDKVDAGEIGAGHTVTALYEIVPVGATAPSDTPAVDGLKYQAVAQGAGSKEQGAQNRELLTVKIRYKEPTGDVSSKLEFPLIDQGASFADATGDFKFAAAVAGLGMTLRDSPYKGGLTLANVLEWGRAGLGQDVGGYRSEFLTLVNSADLLLR
jgi:Ca-activated chloride channel family protein